MLQPTSVPGQSCGCHGPMRPIHSPLDFSITLNIEKPNSCHAPARLQKLRHATEGACTPPSVRITSSSAQNAR